MNHLEKSEVVISRILATLLENGMQDFDLEFADVGLPADYSPYFTSCVRWLMDEGLIRAQNFRAVMDGTSTAINPVVTSSGFHFLGRSIEADGEKISVAEAVKSVSQSSQSYSGFGDFIGGILGGLTKTMGS